MSNPPPSTNSTWPIANMSFDGFAVEGTEQDGQAGISIRDADDSPLGFIPDSFFVAAGEETRKPWRTQGKCLVIHTSLLLMAGSLQAMTCHDAAQSTAPMITDIFHGELEDEFYPRPGKYLPSLLAIAIGLSAYYFCRDRTPPALPPVVEKNPVNLPDAEDPITEETGARSDSMVPVVAASGLLGVLVALLGGPQARLASILTSLFGAETFSIKKPDQI